MASFEIDHAVREVYDAAFDDHAFQAAMSALARRGLAAGHGLEYNRAGFSDTDIMTASEVDPLIGGEIRKYGDDYNIGIQLLQKATTHQPFRFHEFCDYQKLEPGHPTRSFLEPHGFQKVLMTRLKDDGHGISFLTLFRRHADQEYSEEDMRTTAQAAWHVSNALRLRGLRVAADRREQAEKWALSTGKTVEGLIIVSPTMKIRDVNWRAQALLSEGAFVRDRFGHLVSNSDLLGEKTSDLHAFLKRRDPAAGNFYIRDRVSKTILSLTAIPLGPDIVEPVTLVSGGAIAVILSTSPRSSGPDLRAFARAYGLTSAESRVLASLMRSRTLGEAASALGIARDTAKAQLATIFRKTETDTQAQLMLLVSRYL